MASAHPALCSGGAVLARTRCSLVSRACRSKLTYALSLAAKGMSLRAISKAMTRSEESMQARAKVDGLKVSKLR